MNFVDAFLSPLVARARGAGRARAFHTQKSCKLQHNRIVRTQGHTFSSTIRIPHHHAPPPPLRPLASKHDGAPQPPRRRDKRPSKVRELVCLWLWRSGTLATRLALVCSREQMQDPARRLQYRRASRVAYPMEFIWRRIDGDARLGPWRHLLMLYARPRPEPLGKTEVRAVWSAVCHPDSPPEGEAS